MNKSLKFIFPLLILLITGITLLTGTDWNRQTVLWNTKVDSVIVISSGVDTSDVFVLTVHRDGTVYGDVINFFSSSQEGANSDSSNNKLVLQLTNDDIALTTPASAIWFDYGSIDTLLSITTAATLLVETERITEAQLFAAKYGRVIVTGLTTGTDTSVVKLAFTRIITK